MLHPSYTDLMKVVNEGSDSETPVVSSRYSIVMAASKRARQLIDHADPLIEGAEGRKPLSIAVEELNQGQVQILTEEEAEEEEITEEIAAVEE